MPIAPAAHDVGSSALLRDMRIQAEEADEIDEAEMMRALRFVGERKTITPQKENTHQARVGQGRQRVAGHADVAPTGLRLEAGVRRGLV